MRRPGRAANSEWRIANREVRIGMGVERSKHHFLPRSAGVAGLHVVGRVVLSADARLPEGGSVWTVVADQAGCGHGSGQYRGGSWTGKYADLCSIPPHRSRIAEGVGDTFAACGIGRHCQQSNHRCADGAMRGRRKDAPGAHSLATAKVWRTLMRRQQAANREWRIGTDHRASAKASSLFAIRYSLFALRGHA